MILKMRNGMEFNDDGAAPSLQFLYPLPRYLKLQPSTKAADRSLQTFVSYCLVPARFTIFGPRLTEKCNLVCNGRDWRTTPHYLALLKLKIHNS